jgi:hypothetical protein
MPVAAIAGAAIVGAGASIYSAKKAAKAQTKAADQSIAEQRRQYDQTRADQTPWRTAGSAAIDKMAAVYGLNGMTAKNPDGTPAQYGGFFASPDYQFRKDESIKAANAGLASRGLLNSGAAVRAKTALAGNLASSEFGDWWNRLAGVAGVGQTATQATSNAGQNAANNISAAYQNAGNARASAYMNTGAAINNGLQNMAGLYAFNAGGGFGGGSSGATLTGSGPVTWI